MFRLTINYQRFLFLLRCLRFDDRATRAERMQIDNLAAVREICDVLQAKFREAYTPGENVTIDEQLDWVSWSFQRQSLHAQQTK